MGLDENLYMSHTRLGWWWLFEDLCGEESAAGNLDIRHAEVFSLLFEKILASRIYDMLMCLVYFKKSNVAKESLWQRFSAVSLCLCRLGLWWRRLPACGTAPGYLARCCSDARSTEALSR